jgi:hypothetical protein
MLLLLTQGWPWLLLGSVLLFFGISSINLTLCQWLLYLVSLPFILLPDQTKTEKRELDQPVEEVAESNPGCILLLAGTIMIIYGLFRIFT